MTDGLDIPFILDGVSNPLLLKPVTTFPPFPLMEVTSLKFLLTHLLLKHDVMASDKKG